VVQLQSLGPQMAWHNVFSGLRKHSRKIFKSVIFCKACEVKFVSQNCLRWIKRSAFSVYHFVLFIHFTIKLEGNDYPGALDWITSLLFFGARRSLSWKVHLAQWTQYSQINMSTYISAKSSLLKWPSSQINCPSLQ